MAARSRNISDGDLIVRGRLTCGSIQLPNESVGNANIDPEDPIDVTNQEHQYNITITYGDSDDTPADQTKVVHVAFSPGEVFTIRAGLVSACTGDSTVEIDLLKNGSSCLSSTITLDETMDDYDLSEGTVDDSTGEYTELDVFEIVIDVTAGTGVVGQGLFIHVIFREGSE